MKQVERYFYPAVFSYAPDQEIAVTFPDLDVATSGTDDTDALLSARELLGCVLCGLEEDGEDIPAPTPLTDVKLEDGERAVLVDVYMPSVRLARVNRSVNRTVIVPAMCGALMMLTGEWTKPGVYTVEEFNPDPFLDALDKYGLPRSENHDPVLVD